LSMEQPMQLIKLCGFNSKDQFNLLYRASEDGFSGRDFHLKCEGKANTLTILSGNGYIFGGFSSAKWNKANKNSDPNAFLFSLTNRDNQPCKMEIEKDEQEEAICTFDRCGPCFGYGGYDICTILDPLFGSNEMSTSNLGFSFKHPEYAGYKAQSFLAGQPSFILFEIEVYEKFPSLLDSKK
jgi:hypothetical protein